MQRLHDKYGSDDWTVHVLRECSGIEEARQYEQIMLDLAYDLPTNLNTRPDTRVVTKPWTAERRVRMEAMYADPEWRAESSRRARESQGRPEVKQKIAAAWEARRNDPEWIAKAARRFAAAKERCSDPDYRKRCSARMREVHRESSHIRDASRKRQSRRISIEDVTTGEVTEFPSTRVAGAALGIPEGTITMNLTGRSRLVRNRYRARYLEESPIERSDVKPTEHAVRVLNTQTGDTQVFPTIREAADVLDTSERAIRHNLEGKTKLLKRLYDVNYLVN